MLSPDNALAAAEERPENSLREVPGSETQTELLSQANVPV